MIIVDKIINNQYGLSLYENIILVDYIEKNMQNWILLSFDDFSFLLLKEQSKNCLLSIRFLLFSQSL